MELNKIYQGHVLQLLKTFPSNSIDCCITSPPYFQLRQYSTEDIIWDETVSCEHTWSTHTRKPIGGKGSVAANVGANKNDTANMRDHDVLSYFCTKCGAWKGQLGQEPNINDKNIEIFELRDNLTKEEIKFIQEELKKCNINGNQKGC